MSEPYRSAPLGSGSWTQCELMSGVAMQVAWIQTKYAILGASVSVPKSDKAWRVTAVYGTKEQT